jgi:hypothetical protein
MFQTQSNKDPAETADLNVAGVRNAKNALRSIPNHTQTPDINPFPHTKTPLIDPQNPPIESSSPFRLPVSTKRKGGPKAALIWLLTPSS